MKLTGWLPRGIPVLAGLPLLAFAVLYLAFLTRHPVTANTGDPLLDEFAGLVSSQMLAGGNLPQYGMDCYDSGYFGQLGDCDFTGLENRFGEDPRYWMLRYRLQPYVEACPPDMFWVDFEIASLNAAVNRGVTSSEIQFCRFSSYLQGWYGLASGETYELRNQLTRPMKTRTSTAMAAELADFAAAENVIVMQELDTKHGVELDDLANELLAVAPTESLPQYSVAILCALRGEYDAAMDYIRAGNRAPSNTALTGFPLAGLPEVIRNPKYPDNSEVAISLAWLAQGRPAANYLLRLGDCVLILSVEACRRGDMSMLDDLQRFAYRCATQPGATYTQSVIGFCMLSRIARAYNELGPPAPGQVPGFSDLQQKLDALRSKLQQNSTQQPTPYGYYGTPGNKLTVFDFLQITKDQLSMGAGQKSGFLKYCIDNSVFEQRELETVVLPALYGLAGFHYSSSGQE